MENIKSSASGLYRFLDSYLGGLLSYLPLIVFIWYGLWEGPPPPERWITAYKIAAPIAAIHLVIFLYIPKPLNRLMLGINLYLLLGGAMAWFALWNILKIYGGFLMESGVLMCIMVVGAVATFLSPNGFIGYKSKNTALVRKYSYVLLAMAILGFVISFLFRGHRFLGAVVPITALVVTSRLLVDKLKRQSQDSG